MARSCVVAAALAVAAIGAASPAASTPPQPRVAVDQSAVADWAGTTGLAGLSPASAHHVSMQVPESVDLSAVAAWAKANGLSGLSPASVAAAGDVAGTD